MGDEQVCNVGGNARVHCAHRFKKAIPNKKIQKECVKDAILFLQSHFEIYDCALPGQEENSHDHESLWIRAESDKHLT